MTTFNVALAWWEIPTIVTTLVMAWAFFWPADDSGFLGGITRMFMLIPALFVVALIWLIAAVMK